MFFPWQRSTQISSPPFALEPSLSLSFSSMRVEIFSISSSMFISHSHTITLKDAHRHTHLHTIGPIRIVTVTLVTTTLNLIRVQLQSTYKVIVLRIVMCKNPNFVIDYNGGLFFHQKSPRGVTFSLSFSSGLKPNAKSVFSLPRERGECIIYTAFFEFRCWSSTFIVSMSCRVQDAI